MSCHRESLMATVKREIKIRWAKLSRFHGFPEYRESFPVDISASLYIYLVLMAKATRKYFRENFDGAETANT